MEFTLYTLPFISAAWRSPLDFTPWTIRPFKKSTTAGSGVGFWTTGGGAYVSSGGGVSSVKDFSLLGSWEGLGSFAILPRNGWTWFFGLSGFRKRRIGIHINFTKIRIGVRIGTLNITNSTWHFINRRSGSGRWNLLDYCFVCSFFSIWCKGFSDEINRSDK